MWSNQVHLKTHHNRYKHKQIGALEQNRYPRDTKTFVFILATMFWVWNVYDAVFPFTAYIFGRRRVIYHAFTELVNCRKTHGGDSMPQTFTRSCIMFRILCTIFVFAAYLKPDNKEL